MSSPHRSYHSLSPEVREEIALDDETYRRCLEFVRRAGDEAAGVYGPGSMAWLMFREPVLLLGGFRAILLQIAHPAVAAGVEESSAFRNDILGRARRTYTALYELVFGTVRQAMGAGQRLHNIHNLVRGVVQEPSPSPWSGLAYRANDPDLLRWVWATLVDTTMLVYDEWLRPLTLEEKRRYYEEAHLGAALTGVPPEIIPPTLEAFHGYMEAMLGGTVLAVGEIARGQAHVLFNSPYTRTSLDETLTAALLPPPLREAYGLPWDRGTHASYQRLAKGLRLAARLTPASLRAVPAYHQAMLRVARARGMAPSPYGRFLNRLSQWTTVPLSIKV